MKEPKTMLFTVRLERASILGLEKIAEQENRTLSYVVREILNMYLDAQKVV